MKARAATLDRHVGLRPPRDDNSSKRIPLQYWKARDGRRSRRELWERMARTDFRTPRLYVAQDLATGAEVKLDPQQTNYLVNVLRLGAGALVLLFNGRNGEFSASLTGSPRKAASLAVGAQTRPRKRRRTSTICSPRSSTLASTIWRRRPSRWARAA